MVQNFRSKNRLLLQNVDIKPTKILLQSYTDAALCKNTALYGFGFIVHPAQHANVTTSHLVNKQLFTLAVCEII